MCLCERNSKRNLNCKVTHLIRVAHKSVVHVHSHAIKYNEFMHEQACICMVKFRLRSEFLLHFEYLGVCLCVCICVGHVSLAGE